MKSERWKGGAQDPRNKWKVYSEIQYINFAGTLICTRPRNKDTQKISPKNIE